MDTTNIALLNANAVRQEFERLVRRVWEKESILDLKHTTFKSLDFVSVRTRLAELQNQLPDQPASTAGLPIRLGDIS